MAKKDPLPKDLFNILACPICRAGIRYTKDKKSLICVNCGKEYPIKEGVPIMIDTKDKK